MSISSYIISKEKQISKEKNRLEFPDLFPTHPPGRILTKAGNCFSPYIVGRDSLPVWAGIHYPATAR